MPVNLRNTATVMLSVVAALALAACGASDRPPTSPLDPSGEPGDGTVIVGVPTVLPTFPPTGTPDGGTPVTPGTIDDERHAGAAIEALAEWLGVPASMFTDVTVQAETWPNACLGVDYPDVACAEVRTPGVRVTITTFGNGATYRVHADATGRLVWAPLMEAVREVASVEASTGRVSLAPVAGPDEMGSELVVVPGSRVELDLAALAAGDRVYVAVAPAVEPDAEAAPIVFIAPAD